MATRSASRVKIYFDADTDAFDRGVRGASTTLGRFGQLIGRQDANTRRATGSTTAFGTATGKLGGHLRSAAAAGASAAAAYLSISQAKAAIDTTNELAKSTLTLHANLGLATDEASAWAAVAKARGVDMRGIGQAFGILSKNILAANEGSETMRRNFDQLGLSMRDVRGADQDFSGFIGKLSDSLKEMGPGAQRTALQMRLLGRGWMQIAPLMRDGSGALEEQLRLAEEYGLVLTGKTLKAQEQLIASQRETKLAWMGMQVTFTRAVTPMLLDAEHRFQSLAKIMADKRLTDAEKFEKVGNKIAGWSDEALDAFLDVLPTMVAEAGERAPKIAGALVEGFMDAPIWGKVALGGLLFKAMGGGAGLRALGGRIGTLVFGGMGSSTVGRGLGGLAAPGSTPTRPLFTKEVGLGGAPGGVAPTGGGSTIGSALKTGMKYSGPAAAIVGIGAGAYFGTEALRDDKQKSIWDFYLQDLHAYRKDARSWSVEERRMRVEQIREARASGEVGREEARKLIDSLNGIVAAQRPVAAGFDFAKAIAKDGKASDRELGRVIAKLGEMPKAARKEAAETMIGVSRELERKGKLPEGSAKRIRSNIVDEFGDMNVKSVRESVRMVRGIGKTFSGLVGVVSAGLGMIGENTNEALEAFGKKPLKFALKTGSGLEGALGSALGNSVGFFLGGAATGGKIPGYSTVDNHLIAVRGGERVLTPERQYPIADAAMWSTYGMGLDDMLSATGGTMYSKGGRVRGFAKGGATGAAGGLQPGIQRLASILANKFGMTVSSGFRPGDDGFHGRGLAADFAGGDWHGASRYVNQIGSSLLEGIYNPAIYGGPAVSWDSGARVPSSFWGGATWADHQDHIHAAVSGTGGSFAAAGAKARRLKRIKLTGPKGPLRSLGQSALDRARRAGQSYLERQMPKMVSHGNLGTAYKGPLDRIFPAHGLADAAGHVQLAPGQVRMLANKAGLPGSTFEKIAHGESNYYPGIIGQDPGGTRGLGLWQITTYYNDDLIAKFGGEAQMRNPWVNAQAAKAIYDRQGIGAWYGTQFLSRGGRVRGYGAGGVIPQGPPGTPIPGAHFQVPMPDIDLPGNYATGMAGGGGGGGGHGGGGGGSSGGTLAGVPYPNLPFDDRLALLEIDLDNAQASGDGAAISQITAWIVTLLAGGVSDTQASLDKLRLTKRQRRTIRRQARESTAGMEARMRRLTKSERKDLRERAAELQKKLRRKDLSKRQQQRLEDQLEHVATLQEEGILDRGERRELREERAERAGELTKAALAEKRSELISELSSLTSALNGYKDSEAESASDLAAEVRALREAVTESNALAETELGVGITELRRALANMVSGELGGQLALANQTAGAGSVHNY